MFDFSFSFNRSFFILMIYSFVKEVIMIDADCIVIKHYE